MVNHPSEASGRQTSRRAEAGSAFIELGLMLPVLLLILLGAIDFARVFFADIALTNAAEVGAMYGARSVSGSSDLTSMQDASTADAADLSGVTATASQYCTCGNGAAHTCPVSCSGSTMHTFVSVTTSYTFTPLVPFPGIPSSVPMTRTAVMRVQ
jgi:Flp pilus assembly protein TadG